MNEKEKMTDNGIYRPLVLRVPLSFEPVLVMDDGNCVAYQINGREWFVMVCPDNTDMEERWQYQVRSDWASQLKWMDGVSVLFGHSNAEHRKLDARSRTIIRKYREHICEALLALPAPPESTTELQNEWMDELHRNPDGYLAW